MVSAFAPTVIVRSPVQDRQQLRAFISRCLADGVKFIAIIGPGCADLEDDVDALIVEMATDAVAMPVTTSHPDETTEDVLAFLSFMAPSCGGNARIFWL